MCDIAGCTQPYAWEIIAEPIELGNEPADNVLRDMIGDHRSAASGIVVPTVKLCERDYQADPMAYGERSVAYPMGV